MTNQNWNDPNAVPGQPTPQGGQGSTPGYQPPTQSGQTPGYSAPDTTQSSGSAGSYGSAPDAGAGGYNPPAAQGYTPPASQGYTPPAYGASSPASSSAPTSSYGSASDAAAGYTPPTSQSYTPPASQGYTPPASQGYSPPAYGSPDPSQAPAATDPSQIYGSASGAYGSASSYGSPAASDPSSYGQAASYGSPATSDPSSYGQAASYGSPATSDPSSYGSAGSYGTAGSYGAPDPNAGYGASASYGQSQPSSYGSAYGQQQAYQEPPAASAGYGVPYSAGNAVSPYGYDSGYATPAPALSNWGKRALGALVDYGPIVILSWIGQGISSAMINASTGAPSAAGAIISLVLSLAGLGYWVWNTVLKGGKTGVTLGRSIAKTKLVSESTGQPIGPGMAILRQIAHVVDSLICYIGWLFPLWDQKRQTIADKIVKTVVIDNDSPTQQQY